MPTREFRNCSIRSWIVERLVEIGKAMNPPKKHNTLANEILADWVIEHDKKVRT